MLSIIIPVIREAKVKVLLDAIEHAITTPHEVIWEEDHDRIGAPLMVKRLTEKAQGEWICFLGDDTLPHPKSLDTALDFATANNLLLVGLNDEHSRKATHWVAHRDLLSHLENHEFFYTGYRHNFCDDELRHRAQRLGVYGWCEDARVTHNHPAFGTAPMDEGYTKVFDQEAWNHDKALFQSRCCTITVAMIVKNEEAMLSQCLRSVGGADEIVVVDTGSVDATKHAAAQFTSHIYDFEWCDDFAAARNDALAHANGDWVLSIDADEVLDENGIALLKEYLSTEKNAIGIEMKCGNNRYHAPRLFRNTPTVKWQGKIHETITERDFLPTPIGITYGSSPAHTLDPERNMRILEKVRQEDPTNTRNLYYLGREYGYYQQWDNAINTLKEYLTLATWLPERADAYFIQALCYWYSNRGEEARMSLLHAININANFKAALLAMDMMSFEHNGVQWRRMAETATNEGTLFARLTHTNI